MKKFFCKIIAVCTALSLCSCSSAGQSDGDPVISEAGNKQTSETAEQPHDETVTAPDSETVFNEKTHEESEETSDTSESDTAGSETVVTEETHQESAPEAPDSPGVSGTQTVIVESPENIPGYEIKEAYHPEGLDAFYSSAYAAYGLTREEREFTESSVFMGDSICRGFTAYNVVRDENVWARGSVAARSFFDYEMYYEGSGVSYVDALAASKPEYVFLSMGMNDINMTNEDTYCENYRKIIDTTLENSDAVVYICAITPINCDFSTNSRIDSFNAKIEQFLKDNYSERVYYVDFAKHFKDANGNLKDDFNGGDGIHLAPYAYYVALWEINRTMTKDGVKGNSDEKPDEETVEQTTKKPDKDTTKKPEKTTKNPDKDTVKKPEKTTKTSDKDTTKKPEKTTKTPDKDTAEKPEKTAKTRNKDTTKKPAEQTTKTPDKETTKKPKKETAEKPTEEPELIEEPTEETVEGNR